MTSRSSRSHLPKTGFFIMLVALLALAPAWGQNAFVRVNQVGYKLDAPKRAYLMAKGVEVPGTFTVNNSQGAVVFAGSITTAQDQGGWGNFPHVYALDFNSLTTEGTFTIAIHAPQATTSPAFRIDEAVTLYSQPLANTLFFYENERDGPDFIPTDLRTAPGHLNDAKTQVYLQPLYDSNDNLLKDLTPSGATIDVSGGWWDAGDYLKFVETHSYTVALMLIGVRDFPSQMGAASSTSNFTSEARFGLDWLQKMWNDKTRTFHYQVGIGACDTNNVICISDHDIWRLPQADDSFGGTAHIDRFIRHRPVFRNINGGSGAKINANMAGRMAADFALCFHIFKNSDLDYANQCLLSAEHVFALADTTGANVGNSVSPGDFYPEVEWRDDLELGATELYFVLKHAGVSLPSGLPHTDPAFYLQQAAHWASAFIHGPNDAADTLNLFDVSGLAHFELFRAIDDAEEPAGLEVSQAELVADLKKQINHALTQAKTDPFGFGFPWDVFDTTTHGAGLSVMASEYDFLTGTKTFESFANRWLANILGANAWGTSLIVGDGATFPHCMQHQVANLVGSQNGTPPLLRGAAVEGPNSFAATGVVDGMIACPANGVDVFAPFNGDNINGNNALYQDNVQSFSTVEPAIDLTASSPLAFSWLIAGGPAAIH
ncbi:MAG TPA: glycoside hydrolase family 9 protein [Candidatus Angelobacter sp.]